MNSRKLKSYALLASLVFSALILIGWSQTWFVLGLSIPTDNPDGLDISGQVAAPGLSAFGLAGFAVTSALALSSVLIRRILGVLLVLIGLVVVTICVSSWTDPVSASASQLTSLSAISDLETLRTFVNDTVATAWPGVTAISATFLALVGIVIFFTAGKWSTGSRKFDRVHQSSDHSTTQRTSSASQSINADISSENIDSWDSLSNGTDPTIN